MSHIGGGRAKIIDAYGKRGIVVSTNKYAHWKADVALSIAERKFVAAKMLHDAGVFPGPETRCLEIGFGALGWLGDLISWGVRENCICGIELIQTRTDHVRAQLPLADLRTGDASVLPWDNGSFQLVIASTVFTSILEPEIRLQVANEIERVLAPGGVLLWYDFRVNNPANRDVRKVSKSELRGLFSSLNGEYQSVTLAPPLARIIAPWSWTLACLMGCVPFCRTHLMAILLKPTAR